MATPDLFRLKRELAAKSLNTALSLLDRREGDTAFCLQLAFRENLRLAYTALILELPPVQTQSHLADAVVWGLRWFAYDGPGTSFGAVQVDLTVGADGSVTEDKRSYPRTREGPMPLSIGNYLDVLLSAIAFGSLTQRLEAARVPDARYRNPGEVVPANQFVYVQGLKDLAAGDAATAQSHISRALGDERSRWVIPAQRACLALIDRDWSGIEKQLDVLLREYHKLLAKSPGDPAGIMNLSGMAIGRLAIEAGYLPAERPYLPLSLLPNWPADGVRTQST